MIFQNKKLKYVSIVPVFLVAIFAVFDFNFFGNEHNHKIGKSNASAIEKADYNSDGKVDITDLATLLSKWGSNDTATDLNNDNKINIIDLSILLSKWGTVKVVDMPQIVPEFSITPSGGASRYYKTYTKISDHEYTVSDSYISATLVYTSGQRWELRLTPKVAVETVIFPWQTNRDPLDTDISDDYYYYPYLLGQSEKATNKNADWTWWGHEYPGTAAAPLSVMADNDNAKIVAAANWPAKTVKPQYAAQRMILTYKESLSPNTTTTYGAIIAKTTGNESAGDAPWQKAIDYYKNWLDSVATVTYPEWMWQGQGMYQLQMNNFSTYSITNINNTWQNYKDIYPWVLVWGQMSGYKGGCCSLEYEFDSRHASTLPLWMRDNVVANGYRGGYYSAPYWSDRVNNQLTTTQGMSWLTNWQQYNKVTGHSNSHYIDVIARSNWGDPDYVKRKFDDNTISKDSLVEGISDIWPVPGLVSGHLQNGDMCGAPFKMPSSAIKTTFSSFGRYIVRDRMIVAGASNSDYYFSGTGKWASDAYGCDYVTYCAINGPCEYGTERMMFLLGARIEACGNCFAYRQEDPITQMIINERQRTNWWDRRPAYYGPKGINMTTITPDKKIEISSFKDKNGRYLLAVSNPLKHSGLYFTFNGNRVDVPAKEISIIEPN